MLICLYIKVAVGWSSFNSINENWVICMVGLILYFVTLTVAPFLFDVNAKILFGNKYWHVSPNADFVY